MVNLCPHCSEYFKAICMSCHNKKITQAKIEGQKHALERLAFVVNHTIEELEKEIKGGENAS